MLIRSKTLLGVLFVALALGGCSGKGEDDGDDGKPAVPSKPNPWSSDAPPPSAAPDKAAPKPRPKGPSPWAKDSPEPVEEAPVKEN